MGNAFDKKSHGRQDFISGSAKTKTNKVEAPSISLPKGGGAIKSIDEKFSVNAANGTSGFNIPFPLSSSRNSFIPGMSLSYKSGNGNGLFGLGWNADPPSISRRTDKKLPLYDDDRESDTFIFSGSEDLVPSFTEKDPGEWVKDEFATGDNFTVRYRPRIEGIFARIEKIKERDNNVFWKITSRDNVVSVFGKSTRAQIFDPINETRIYRWYLEFSYDDKGNCFQYEYEKENKVNVPDSLHEKNRLNDHSTFTNSFLKRIKYANKAHFNKASINFDDWENFLSSNEYLLELVMDFGDHDSSNPQPLPDKDWECRSDPFSVYNSGFEIRTYRLCRRLLMFHRFAELGEKPCLVRSLTLDYNSGTAFTFLTSATHKGFIRKQDGTYSEKSIPPVEFSYEPLGWSTEIKSIPQESLENLPVGINDKSYKWIDLYGEGISGIITEQANGWYYKSNSGEGNLDHVKLIANKPSLAGLANGSVHFQDLDANGQNSLVSNELDGYFGLTPEKEWLPFKSFNRRLNIDMRDSNVRHIDLDGDGKADILISEDEMFVWYESLGSEGFNNYRTIRKSRNEEAGPAISFSDISESIVLADMSGDGLLDIVRIRNHDIVYWPNLGYGKFGAKVSMSNSPVFDQDDRFDPRLVKLSDIDGSGTTDIVYLGDNSFKIYFNQSGNSWSEENSVSGSNPLPSPKIDNSVNINIVDLLGNGTGCIVWSSPLPEHVRSPLRYINPMDGKKPHILTSYKNNMGKEVFIHYKPSTFFYIEDRIAGTPWVTKLPFPVHCVSEMEVVDHITKTRYTSKYKYHHGYYDYTEREFRGFGRVDQTDTESFENFSKKSNPDGSIQIVDKSFFQPPALTKTWYHTGAFSNNQNILNRFAGEYFKNQDIPEKILAEPDLSPDWTPEEWREAARSCKGLPLHVEVYSLDGSTAENIPYTTSQHSCLIKLVQPRLENKYAVFNVLESESLTYTYERNPADPRISHNLTIETDVFGNILQAAVISYSRKTNDNTLTLDEQSEQSKIHIVFNQNNFTDKIDNGSDYRLPALYELKSFELTGNIPEDLNFFSIDQVRNDFQHAALIAFKALPASGAIEKRLIEHDRTLFSKNDLSGPLDLGETESLMLPYQSYQLVLTPDLVTYIFGNKVTDELLVNEGKYYKFEDGNYWIASGTRTFDPDHFYQVTEIKDSFDFRLTISFDTEYHFFVTNIADQLQNINSVKRFNFRTLSPFVLQDINDNLIGVRLDELNSVQNTFVMGKENESKGDLIDMDSAEGSSADQPTNIFEYNLFNYINNGKPNFVKTLVRETHHFESIQTGNPVVWQTSYSYSDGSGNLVMSKIQAEPGIALRENDDGTIEEVDTTPELRWVGNGRTILNNKGKPVMQYEPYFSTNFEYEDSKNLVERGVTPIIYYDSIGRVIRTDMPDGTFSKVEFDIWSQKTFDPNDTVLESQWYRDRIISPVPVLSTPEEIDAANKAAVHADTPLVTYLDSLGRSFLSVEDNAIDGKNKIITATDIEGNVMKLTDARGNLVMLYKYDMLGNPLYQKSMDAGERWFISDSTGKPIRSWDNRNNEFSFEYDELHRPVIRRVKVGDGFNSLDNIFEKIIYGENLANDKEKNFRGRPVIIYDTAGKNETSSFDFKGNVLSSELRFTSDYKNVVNWNIQDPDTALENESFQIVHFYDALNRIVRQITPDHTIYEPFYNQANFLEKVKVTQNGVSQEFVKNIDYDEKGQRKRIVYGNDIVTKYFYNSKTFRLTHLETKRMNNDPLQDLHYSFDPVGNITRINDKNIPAVFFNNQKVEAFSDFTYDAIYRLTEASGREHAGQLDSLPADNWNDLPFLKKYSPGGAMEWRNYKQQYRYDRAGNMLQMVHTAGTGSWTRGYTVDQATNRLLSTTIGSNTYDYTYHPQHGFITAMPHLQLMRWNFKDELQAAAQQKVVNGTPEITYYVYDSNGFRTRKITERQASLGETPSRKSERIYVAGIEIYREYDNTSDLQLERQSFHVSDDKSRIAMIETRSIGTDDAPARLVRYQFENHLGSSCLETDESATVISYEEFHPYGTTSYQANNGEIKAAYKRYRNTGMERDEESGLEYHNARYYIPWLARWACPDPSGIKDGLNLFISFHNNPVMFSDPDGNNGKPEGFLEYASSVESGLERIVELGLKSGKIEYGLGLDPKTKQLMVIQGSGSQVAFGKLVPVGHTHTGNDKTVAPSTADLNEFARGKVKEHWLFSTDEGWARLRYDPKTKTFDMLRNKGGKAVRYTYFENPDFNPRDKSPYNQASRWKISVGDIQGDFDVKPPQTFKFSDFLKNPFDTPIFEKASRVLHGTMFAAGLFVMGNRYRKAIQSDISGHTGGTNTLNLVKSDITWYAVGEGVSALGPMARTAVANAGYFFIATEVGKIIFGEDDTLRWDPISGREIRWMEIADPEANKIGLHVSTVHVIDFKTGKWAEAKMRCQTALDVACPYLTDREYQELTDPWR